MMKAAILALLYLSAPALIVTDDLPNVQSPTKGVSVIYKSSEVDDTPVSFDLINVADDENCDDVIFDFEAKGETALHRYTMLRTE